MTLAIALAASLFVPLDTLTFEDGEVHFLNAAAVGPDDDIVVRGIGFGGANRTVVVITGAARARDVTLWPGGDLVVRDSAKVQSVTTEGATFAAQSVVLVGDSEVEGAITLAERGTATLSRNSTAGSVWVGADTRLNLDGDATVQGDVTAAGEVHVSGGTVLGAMDLAGGILVDESVRPLQFTGPVSLTAPLSSLEASRPVFTRSRFHGDLVVGGGVRMEIQGSSEVSGTLRVEDEARVILFLDTAQVPSGMVSAPSGVILGTNTAGVPVAYAYEREPGAVIIVESGSDPTSTTTCAQSLPNSTGFAAHVTALGGTDAAAGELILRADGVPTNSFAYFFVGTARVQSVAPSGDLCAGGNLGRFVGPGQIMNSGMTGTIAVTINTAAIPGNPSSVAMPGSTYYFQLWNRDAIGGLPSSRFSDTAAVTFR